MTSKCDSEQFCNTYVIAHFEAIISQKSSVNPHKNYIWLPINYRIMST